LYRHEGSAGGDHLACGDETEKLLKVKRENELNFDDRGIFGRAMRGEIGEAKQIGVERVTSSSYFQIVARRDDPKRQLVGGPLGGN
jgi:hypothetical protein